MFHGAYPQGKHEARGKILGVQKSQKLPKMGKKGVKRGLFGGAQGLFGGAQGLFGGARHPFVPRWLCACPKVKIAILSTINITIIYTISHNMSKQIVRFSKHNTTLISVKNL